MLTNKKDRDGKILQTYDVVELDGDQYIINYGNYVHLGTERIGFFIEQLYSPNRQLPLTNQVKKIA